VHFAFDAVQGWWHPKLGGWGCTRSHSVLGLVACFGGVSCGCLGVWGWGEFEVVKLVQACLDGV
jgi:hypothetical protein